MAEETAKPDLVKVDRTYLMQLIEEKDSFRIENAELKGDIDFFLDVKTKIDDFKANNSHVIARLTKAFQQGKILALLGIDKTKFDAMLKKYNLDLDF
ncbi:MAG: hypothetical protein GY810_05560 [Aureispira sp.]|nr:hypothetical protein [Aureispira sp.]